MVGEFRKPSDAKTLRPKNLPILLPFLIIFYIGMAFAIIEATGNFQNKVDQFAILTAFILALYLILVKPRLIFLQGGIMIINPIFTTQIGWNDVIEFDTKYTFLVEYRDQGLVKRIHSWAASAPGRLRSQTVHASEIKGIKPLEGNALLRPGDSPRSDSGVALAIATQFLREFKSKSFAPIGTKTHRNLTLPIFIGVLVLIGIFI